VELNEQLAQIAQKNVTLRKRVVQPRAKITIMRQDATEFRWPRSPVLVYLNNPFDCTLVELFAAKMATVAATGPGIVDLLYVNPACTDVLTGQGFFKLLWNAQIEMDEADQQADPYGASSDRVAAFRFCAEAKATRVRDGIRP